MLVVADSSPINILIRIDLIELLPKLFGRVLIPPQVHSELTHRRTPQSVLTFVSALPNWMEIRAASQIESIPPLDPGEEAAISLAAELRADALLIDEKDGRRAATLRKIPIIGTLGLLERAARDGHIEIVDAINRLKSTDFRINVRLIEDALKRINEAR